MLDNKGFDLWADGYDKSVELSEEDHAYPFAGYKDVLNAAYKIVCETERARVLDIGFGTAVLTQKLYDEGYQILGIDFSSRMTTIAQAKMPNAVLIDADISHGLPAELHDESFDFIVSTYALHHLQDEAKVALIDVLQEHLTKNGKMIIGDIAFASRELHDACKLRYQEIWDPDERYFVYDELNSALAHLEVSFEALSHCAGVLVMTKPAKTVDKIVDKN